MIVLKRGCSMRIDSISLNNFGSYEGETIFDTNSASGRNIILIGGKNGTGKTTLFTAMRVCLYGYMSMGYRSYNAFYIRAITKLINNNAKMVKPTEAYVAMKISLNNGREMDHYELVRSWYLSDTLNESFLVTRNDVALSSQEIADFEKFMLSMIPPELFNLYFFDGEKISDFFMNEGSNTRIKDAFLTLCGYDTFDIMRRNFKRISNSASTSAPALDEYWEAKQGAEQAQQTYKSLLQELSECEDLITACEADIVALEKAYSQKGGISQEEWTKRLVLLRDEEKKRDAWNAMLRKWANEMIPFLMIRDQIVAVKEQIVKENNNRKYHNFCEILESPEIRNHLGTTVDRIKKTAFMQYGSNESQILDLSLEQSAALLAQIGVILSFDVKKIGKCKRAIKKSISISAQLRQELENSSISAVQEYMNQRSALFEKKSDLLVRQVELEKVLAVQKEKLQLAEATLGKTQEKLEAELKKASINDISARAIVMLDKLQRVLYRQQIVKVEDFFRTEIKTLLRKTNFIDDIKIDDDFNIFLYRHEPISCSILLEALEEKNESHLIEVIGYEAVQELYKVVGSSRLDEVTSYCASGMVDQIVLPIRVDQTALSNGEKQIFIMALYYSLVQLGRQEIPFVIDTPFARIDTEHRQNISTHFFGKLRGQVFILSTNEEINSGHVQIMRDKIATTYMLENSDDKRTVVKKNSYFEV